MKHIGILAHSFEGAGLCFRTACLAGVERLGAHMHPEISMTCSPMALAMPAWESGDHAPLRTMFGSEAAKLAAAGADFFVCPDNTAHIALEQDGAPFAIPALHIGEVVAEEARRQGFAKVGILGTKYTMTGPVYPAALARRGIGYAVPSGVTEPWSTTSSSTNCVLANSPTRRAAPIATSSASWRRKGATRSRWCAPKSRC
ncbi:aspartate/glutamate racemase family protein [Sphingomonas lutea]|uniref:aspartate/glutamate racemase family protein n=1 Tax=Sphingomonas lutea TaxID=1045317 RepID=UPI001CB714C0|nr:aspartate/glutamate racemase family protein [Sphingomonas lutea]